MEACLLSTHSEVLMALWVVTDHLNSCQEQKLFLLQKGQENPRPMTFQGCITSNVLKGSGNSQKKKKP